MGVRRAFLENSLRKNNSKTIFQILTKDFSVNGNYFSFYHHFTKQIPTNLKIFFKKYFITKQTNGALKLTNLV